MKSGKVWGETNLILRTPFIEIHKLYIEPNSFCSVHKHEYKWNFFYVISGALWIETRKNNYKLTDVTNINQGEYTTVKPGEFHKFYTLDEPVDALEIYYPEPLSEDIIRETVGGYKS